METVYIGAGDIELRIYDKYAEVLHSGKAFFLDVWGDKVKGDEVKSVWRVEGQLRQPVLKQFGIHCLPDLYARLGGLWKYLTEWASLRLPDDAVRPAQFGH